MTARQGVEWKTRPAQAPPPCGPEARGTWVLTGCLEGANVLGVQEMADKETIVTTDGGGGSGVGAVLAVVGIIALLVAAYLIFGGNLLNGGTEKIDADVKIETPSK
jgi:hypothetical protein